MNASGIPASYYYCFGVVLINAFWVIGQFFDKRKFMNYVKAYIAYFSGMITFYIVAIGIEITIDVMR